MGIINVNLPATDEWKELMKRRTSHKLKDFMGIGKDMDIEDVKILYKLSEDGERATLYDIYKDGMKLEGDGIVVPLSSIYKGDTVLDRGKQIVNVINSKNDTIGLTNYSGPWIAVYSFITGSDAKICCTDGKAYYEKKPEVLAECNANLINGNHKNCLIHGGHVIIGWISTNGTWELGTVYDIAKEPDANDLVAIMPICPAHNNHWRNQFYMIVGRDTPAVVITYTVSRTVFKNYIN